MVAARILAVGHSVIVDAVLDRVADRAALEAVARHAGVPFDGFWLLAPPASLAARVAGRRHDPSDATVEVVEQQIQRDRGAMTWREIDATGGREETALLACKALRL
jgi:predicted kinase